MARLRRNLTLLLVPLAIMGCNSVPVTPWVSFSPYTNPLFDHTDFETLFQAWRMGRSVTWSAHLLGTSFTQQELVLKSTGEGSLGAVLPGAVGATRTFKVSNAELLQLVSAIQDSGVLTLYDGHYGAYLQAGGQGGPELTLYVGTLVKHVSKDDALSPSVSFEAKAIQKAADALADVALRHLQ